MGSSVSFNGSTYIIPSLNDTGWGRNVSSYLIAIAAGCLQNVGGSFTLNAEVDFGATYGLKTAYYKSHTANPASAGQVRLASSDSIQFRNNLGSGDIALSKDSSDNLLWNSTKLLISGAIVNADISNSAAIALSKLAAVTASKALVSDVSGVITPSSVTATELGYVSGVTSALQTQMDSKFASAGGTISGDTTMASGKGILFTDGTTHTVKIKAPTTSATWTLALPTGAGSTGQILQTDGSGNSSWVNAPGTGTVNTGTANQLAYYASSTNAVSGLTAITASRALASDVNGLPVAATTTATELGYVNGVTSAIQTQLGTKAPLASPTFTGTVTVPNTGLSIAGNQAFPIVQIVSFTTTTSVDIHSGSYSGTNLTASITPKFSTSKILVTVSGSATLSGTGSVQANFAVFRNGSTNLSSSGTNQALTNTGGSTSITSPISFQCYDSPATTSSTSYLLQILTNGSGQHAVFPSPGDAFITLMEIAQ